MAAVDTVLSRVVNAAIDACIAWRRLDKLITEAADVVPRPLSDAVPQGSSHTDRTRSAAAALADETVRLEMLISRALSIRRDALRIIDAVNNPRAQQLLTLRYIDGATYFEYQSSKTYVIYDFFYTL